MRTKAQKRKLEKAGEDARGEKLFSVKLSSAAPRKKVDVSLCVAAESSELVDDESLPSKWMMLTPKYRETLKKSSYDRRHRTDRRIQRSQRHPNYSASP